MLPCGSATIDLRGCKIDNKGLPGVETSPFQGGRASTEMALRSQKNDRSRFAKILFNSVARRMGLAWQTSSRGLAIPAARRSWGLSIYRLECAATRSSN
jgi:hypothetical protein